MITPILLCGGSGTRLWPLSRKSYPKQFAQLLGEESLFQASARRLAGARFAAPLVVTDGDFRFIVTEQLAEAGIDPGAILIEPQGRNTAPCIALAAFEIERRDPDAVQIVLPADHVIEPAESFRSSLRAAAGGAQRDARLVTLGVRPTFPATGYGYIEQAEELARHGNYAAHRVERFQEKPKVERAREFLESGRFLWNAGIFVWQTKTVIAALRQFAPEILEPLEQAGRATDLADIYPELPALPVDIAIMEPADNRSVLPIEYRWDDVGSWTSLPEVTDADGAGNCSAGEARALFEDAKDNIVYGEAGTLTAMIGVQDLVVVRAGDAVLVCPKDRAQDVKLIVERLKRDGGEFL